MDKDVTRVVTADGRVLVLLPLALFESLSDRAGAAAWAPSAFLGFAPPAVRADIAAGLSPLAAWRRHRGVSQSELSELSGVSRHTVMRMEAGGRGTGSHTSRCRIAKALGIEIGEL